MQVLSSVRSHDHSPQQQQQQQPPPRGNPRRQSLNMRRQSMSRRASLAAHRRCSLSFRRRRSSAGGASIHSQSSLGSSQGKPIQDSYQDCSVLLADVAGTLCCEWICVCLLYPKIGSPWNANNFPGASSTILRIYQMVLRTRALSGVSVVGSHIFCL